MISREQEARIARLFHVEKWPIETIANELDVHHSVVRRVLAQNGVAPGRLYLVRPSMIDPYREFIEETLERYPRIRASRLYAMVHERGYAGGPDWFRHQIAHLRPARKKEAFLHLRTLPGEQAQVDWAHFGTIPWGRARRHLSAFVMALRWCRKFFVRFYLSQRMPDFVRGHVAAFGAFGGVARVCLYDNPKTVVLERKGDAIRFHPTLLSLARHYTYEPRACAPYRANEKGSVESCINYLRQAFYVARQWKDIDDLNAQVQAWCDGPAADRPCPSDRSMTVREAFEREREHLLALPDNPFPTDERIDIRVGKFPYVRFDLNDYSVPHTLAGSLVTVVASLETVRVLDGTEEVARHARSFDKESRVEDPGHIDGLVEYKRRARRQRAMDRLYHAAPSTEKLLAALAQAGQNLGSATVSLVRLLDLYGAAELDSAIAEALEKNSPHPHSVRHILERRSRARGQSPPLPVRLPEVAERADWAVPPHNLDGYDRLGQTPTDDEESCDDDDTDQED